ncbi:MAG: hypothetical protein A3G84_07310 [Chloroflexi bacterium RIFCSPLOWO2_12_FULL_71_12]|nr:MAG: hypothetical protein A3G84_07310 [Chloroflexi bacterium RIFCSPLOWO2_12_FULL_71_12]
MRSALSPLSLLVLAALLAGCSAADLEPDLAELQADPGYALVMPGADLLATVGDRRISTITGPQPAFAGHIFGTFASSDEVYAWYEAELSRLGWSKDRAFGRSTVELENREYCRPGSGARFRLAIKDKDRAFREELYKGRDYVTVFDARLMAVPMNAPCP